MVDRIYEPYEFTVEIDIGIDWDEAWTGSAVSSTPNPWLNAKLAVTMFEPGGTPHFVTGFFAGDGSGGAVGKKWKWRFLPEVAGTWTFKWELFSANRAAIPDDRDIGTARATGTSVDLITRDIESVTVASGAVSSVTFSAADTASSNPFFAYGPIRKDSGRWFYRHKSGRQWVSIGMGSPENFLGYHGFDGARDFGNLPGGAAFFLHNYTQHVSDWNTGDPDWTATDVHLNGNPNTPSASFANAGRGIIGALNYLAASGGCNSLYLLFNTLGGDARDCWPWVSSSPGQVYNYDIGRLRQWRKVLEHGSKLGIAWFFYFAETEEANEQWLSNAGPGGTTDTFGIARKLFFRMMVAMFGDLPGVKWVLCEETGISGPETSGFNTAELRAMALYLQNIDPYSNPISTHSLPITNMNDPHLGTFDQVLPGNSPPGLLDQTWLDVATIQYGGLDDGTNRPLINRMLRHLRSVYSVVDSQTGRPRKTALDCDEQNSPGPINDGVSAASGQVAFHRKNILFQALLNGAASVQWFFGEDGTDQSLGSDNLFNSALSHPFTHASGALAVNKVAQDIYDAHLLPTTDLLEDMVVDHTLVSAPSSFADEVACFYKADTIYLGFIPHCGFFGSAGTVDLSGSLGTTTFSTVQWINPATGATTTIAASVQGGAVFDLGPPPTFGGDDYLFLIK